MGRNGACVVHVRKVQGCDCKVAYAASNAHPVANRGSGGPLGGQDVVRIIGDMGFESKKSILICGEVGNIRAATGPLAIHSGSNVIIVKRKPGCLSIGLDWIAF
ncbi:hypothetical protein ACE6H2_023886 [Prunus campanulata]